MKWKLATFAIAAGICGVRAYGDSKPALTTAQIDQMVRAQWTVDKVVPAAPVDDARFLRRTYLDIVGKIPTAEVVAAFLADKSPDKRVRAVDTLLRSEDYAVHWTTYWDNVLMGRNVRANQIDRVAWRKWLFAEFAKNAPWNRFVYDLITASGQNSTGGSYAKAVGLMMRPGMAEEAAIDPKEAGKVNGATNWILKYTQNPADLSGAASKYFLGVQIQCAQCHDHKIEKWKQDDFRRFTACFMNARPVPVGDMAKGRMRKVELRDINRPFVQMRGKKQQGRNEYVGIQPAALDGTDFTNSPNRRQALAEWMTKPENPYFAEAIVNRMWAHFMGRGFVDPIDDFRPSNPGVLPGLLKSLADDFVAHDYDLKHLIKQITASQVYNLSSGQAKNVDPDNKYWARFRLKPMGPEELLDSLVTATNMNSVIEKVAGGNLDAVKFQLYRQFTFLFDTDEESEQKDFEGTIPQALMLLNGTLVNRGASPIPGTALADVLNSPGGDSQKIESLYLRTLSRKPTTLEVAKWTAFLGKPRDAIVTDSVPERPLNRQEMRKAMQAKQGLRKGGANDPLARMVRYNDATPSAAQQAYEDLFWTLLNSSEFIFNH